jgi:hypothetical protein
MTSGSQLQGLLYDFFRIFLIHIKPVQRSRYAEWLGAGWPGGRSSSPGKGKTFLTPHVVQTGSGAHSASYPMGTGGFYPGIKQPGSEADHSPPTSAEVKNTHTSSRHSVYLVTHGDNSTFTFHYPQFMNVQFQ